MNDLLPREVDRVTALFAGVGIPPMPSILEVLRRECAGDAADLGAIEEAVSRDVALSGALLRVVNSPLFGLRRKVTTVHQALNYLGLDVLAQLVRSVVLRQQFAETRLERFWDASSKMALACALLARRTEGVDIDKAYTYGLFQDCGIPLMLRRFPDYKTTLARANEEVDRSFTEVEEVAYTTNHCVVGYLLARGWGLDDALCGAVLRHHETDVFEDERAAAAVLDLVSIARVAEQGIQRYSGLARTREWEKNGDAARDYLGLAEEDLDEYQSVLEEVLQDAESSFPG